LGKELCGGTKPFKLVVAQEGDGSTCAAGKAGSMGGQDKSATLLLDIGEGVEYLGGHFGIEGGGGFVQKKNFGLMPQGAYQSDALSLASRKFGGFFVGVS
jgi:hypothetical protein